MNIKKTVTFTLALIVLFGVGMSFDMVHAADPEVSSVNIDIPNPLKDEYGDTLQGLLRAIVDNVILPIGGVLAVMSFIYSGFLYVTAQGDETKIKTAHKALLYTAVGTAVLLGAWVISAVIEATITQLRG